MDKFYAWLEENKYGFVDKESKEIFLFPENPFYSESKPMPIDPTDLMLIGYKLKYLQEKDSKELIFYSIQKLLENNFIDDIIRRL